MLRRQGDRYIVLRPRNTFMNCPSCPASPVREGPIRGVHYDPTIIFMGADAYRSIQDLKGLDRILDDKPRATLEDTLPDIRIKSSQNGRELYG